MANRWSWTKHKCQIPGPNKLHQSLQFMCIFGLQSIGSRSSIDSGLCTKLHKCRHKLKDYDCCSSNRSMANGGCNLLWLHGRWRCCGLCLMKKALKWKVSKYYDVSMFSKTLKKHCKFVANKQIFKSVIFFEYIDELKICYIDLHFRGILLVFSIVPKKSLEIVYYTLF